MFANEELHAVSPATHQVKMLMLLRLQPYHRVNFLKQTKVYINVRLIFFILLLLIQIFTKLNGKGMNLLHFVTFLIIYLYLTSGL
jgi:hypothetical protein